MPLRRFCCALALLLLTFAARPAAAQGLLWSIPNDDGVWVRYEGTYETLVERPNQNAGPLTIKKSAELTIKSVGTDTVDIEGEAVKCRWIEFKLITGEPSAMGIQPGLYGVRIYKVLVPEENVIGKLSDADEQPITHIPIVRGIRRLGNRPAEAVQEPVLTVYPVISMLAYYPDFKVSEGPVDDPGLPAALGTVNVELYEGKETVESLISRSTNTGKIWLTSEVPFGWAKYSVQLLREEKDNTAKRSEFKKASEVKVEMKAVESGGNAQSELDESQIGAPVENTEATTTPATPAAP